MHYPSLSLFPSSAQCKQAEKEAKERAKLEADEENQKLLDADDDGIGEDDEAEDDEDDDDEEEVDEEAAAEARATAKQKKDWKEINRTIDAPGEKVIRLYCRSVFIVSWVALVDMD